jgi:hypothetical protein
LLLKSCEAARIAFETAPGRDDLSGKGARLAARAEGTGISKGLKDF